MNRVPNETSPRRCGRALKGQRVHASTPHGHWQTTTMISSIRLDGTTACMALEGTTDTESFRAYVSQVLLPTLRPGDLVIMDNLSPHKSDPTLALNHQRERPGTFPAGLFAGPQSH